jgi:hypothetical protein
MNSDERDNLDIKIMEEMSDQEVERYTRLLEQEQDARAELDRARSDWEAYDEQVGHPTCEFHQYKKRAMEAYAKWSTVVEERMTMVDKVTAMSVATIKALERTIKAWKRLAVMAVGAIEELVNFGRLPDKSLSRRAYWLDVYRVILDKYGAELGRQSIFRHVKVVEFLRTVLPNRLPQLAQEQRDRGKVILAQALEELAERP